MDLAGGLILVGIVSFSIVIVGCICKVFSYIENIYLNAYVAI